MSKDVSLIAIAMVTILDSVCRFKLITVTINYNHGDFKL